MTLRAAAIAAAAALIAGALASAPRTAAAGTCTVSSVAPVAFGGYDVFAPSPVDSTGSITIDCADVAPEDAVRVELSGGASGDPAQRTLVAGPFTLLYNLYLDAGRTTVWGEGLSGYGPFTPPEGPTTLTVHGRIPARQNVTAGSYGDTVTVTVQF